MVDITDEIIEKLKAHSFSIPFKDIRKPYESKKPSYPLLLVYPIRNDPLLQLHGEEILSKVAFRFEVYTRDTSHEGTVYSKSQVSSILSIELDEFIRTTYGLMRVGDPNERLYSGDDTIMRYIVSYGGTLDNKTKIIYQ